eukprot:contig_9614_g2300
MADAAFVAAAGAAAEGLGDGGAGDSDDELDEVEDFGVGAIAADRLTGAFVPVVRVLDFETDCAERAARRASSQNAAYFAMSEKSWASVDGAAARFIRFLAQAYAVVNVPGGETVEEQGLRQVPYVPGCKSADDPYTDIPEADRTPSQIATGETQQGCPLLHSIVVEWLQGSHKRATSLGEEAAQTPPVTVETMTAACDLATTGFDDPDAADDLTALQYRRLTLYTIMVFRGALCFGL